MRDFTHPPGLGARREIASLGALGSREPLLRHVQDLVLRVETITKCGLIAEVVSENGYVTLYATRRMKKVRRG